MEIDIVRGFRTATAVLSTCIMILTGVGYFFLLQPQIPLFYSLARVEDQMTNKEWIFLFPAFALLMMLFERLESRSLQSSEAAGKILTIGTT
ncbi:MAG: hypothetical protein AAB612_00095, partial [Patescibacteria group bacterium]